MKRPAPARLRELRLGGSDTPTSQHSGSIFSRVPLGSSVQDWAAGDHVPGLLIPIAFLSSLRANLQISTCDELYSPSPFSVVNSPNPFQNQTYLPLSESRVAIDVPAKGSTVNTYTPNQQSNFPNENDTLLQIDDDDVELPEPSVTTFFTKKDDDISAALQLIAESVEEQRLIAVKSIVFHPWISAVSTLIFLTSLKMLYTGRLLSDLIPIMSVWIGYSMVGLFILRRLIRGYYDIATRVGGWSWLSESSVSGVSHRRDEVLVAQSDEGDIVGVLVLRMAKMATGAGTPGFSYGVRSRRKSSARWTGIIRAWSVRESDRMQGIGKRLLDQAVANCQLRGLDGPIFAEDHANATKVLPRMFNSVFEKRESWAKNVLQETIIEHRGH